MGNSVYIISAVSTINSVRMAFMAVFSAGMTCRIIKTFFDTFQSDSGTNWKKIRNEITALIVVNCLAALASRIGAYYADSYI